MSLVLQQRERLSPSLNIVKIWRENKFLLFYNTVDCQILILSSRKHNHGAQ